MIDASLFCKTLKFAAHAAAKMDVRYYLNGVRFELKGEVLTLLSTCGARAAVSSVRLDPGSLTDGSVTVGNDDVKRLLTAFGKEKGQLTIDVETVPGNVPRLHVSGGGVALDLKGLDGVYPDVRRIVPSNGRETGSMPHLDANLLGGSCAAIAPLAQKYKGAVPVLCESSGKHGDTVVVRPSAIDDPRVTEVIVVISPTRN